VINGTRIRDRGATLNAPDRNSLINQGIELRHRADKQKS